MCGVKDGCVKMDHLILGEGGNGHFISMFFKVVADVLWKGSSIVKFWVAATVKLVVVAVAAVMAFSALVPIGGVSWQKLDGSSWAIVNTMREPRSADGIAGIVWPDSSKFVENRIVAAITILNH